MNPIEQQLGDLHHKGPPRRERRGPAKVVDVAKARASYHVEGVIQDREGRANRWTEDQKARLRDIAEQYQSLAIRMMQGEDISEELHEVFVKARSVVPIRGVEVVKELLVRWLGSVHDSLFPE